jgi:hypothetical protein
MGLDHPDHYKRLKLLQDVDLIIAETRALIDHHGISAEAARAAVVAMLDDQPLPLQGGNALASH